MPKHIVPIYYHTRLQIKHLKKNVIEAPVLTEYEKGENVFIPRIPIIPYD
jgi:ATP-dependent DNA helicase PIF1